MEMNSELEDIERRLRAFNPRRPAPLPATAVLFRSRRPFAIAAAVALAASTLIVWRLKHEPLSPGGPAAVATLGPLTTLVVEHPDEFDAALTRISLASLPDLQRPGRVLRKLAKE